MISGLQPIQIALGTVQNGTGELNLQYAYGQRVGGILNVAKSNGNVLSQTITVPAAGAIGVFSTDGTLATAQHSVTVLSLGDSQIGRAGYVQQATDMNDMNKMVSSIIILCVLTICASNTNGQKQSMNCNFWQSRVNPEIKMRGKEENPSTDLKVLLETNNSSVLEKPFNDLNQKEIFFGVVCLLNLEGNKKDSNLSGATRTDVSQTFGATSVEVAALYYISYIFFQK